MVLTADKAELLDSFAAALRLSGWQVLWLNNTHPAAARLLKDGMSIDAWVHIWNVTPGGRAASRPLERRIQPTGIGDHFFARKDARTLILGWSDEAGVFAAFDYSFHSGAIGKSPSIQTDLPALQDAVQDGLGVFAKGTGELSIAVRPDMLGLYLEHMDALHAAGTSATQLEMLRRMAASPLDVEFAEIAAEVPRPRRKVMITTLRSLRNRRFSDQVLKAYAHRCAFCDVQLRLVDAAHILPVAHPDSDDQVTNGVALCALHHRAYDAALVTFTEVYAIRLNQTAIADLTGEGRHGGFAKFRAGLRPGLRLPGTKASYPSLQNIRQANALRGWT